ncbi:hypothetical protein [Nocardioides convexus]|uniref:hypothetical protein n=1 Tax=Nocardioides convexus TaxID=2712224 RepID=UPI00241893AD|nr:hypothetical protein [Nocardioides convexus]
MASRLAETAERAGADVRLRRVRETAPDEVVQSVDAWAAHAASVADQPVAEPDDLAWADAVIMGSGTRYGHVTSQPAGLHRHPRTAVAAGCARRQGLLRLHLQARPCTAARSRRSWRCTRPSATSAASSCRPATPTRSSSTTATRTASAWSPAGARC